MGDFMDRYFDAMGTLEEKKMTEIAKAMCGHARIWWFSGSAVT